MLWRGDIGFRRPDAIEVKWNGTTGALLMGEIEMWEQWRKVGEGQEGEGREMQPADVSATSNETDARDREGRAGTPSILGGAQGKEGNTDGEPETDHEVARTQGSTKRSARTQLNGTGGRATGYAHTHVRTYVRVGKYLGKRKRGTDQGLGRARGRIRRKQK